MVLPDLEFDAREYINNFNCDASISFLRKSHLGEEKREQGIIKALINYLGNSKHLWMWDYKSLKKELEYCGFQQVRRAKYNDNKNINFLKIEEEGRWNNCLGIECFK